MNALIGDIGGTKTILAVLSDENGPFAPLVERSFPSSRYVSLESIIEEFLRDVDLPIEKACFGVAGPVLAGRARITNLTWTIDSETLKNNFGWKAVKLLNDLESVAYAIPILRPEDLHTLRAGEPVPNGVLSVVAPGTGLGEGFLTFDNRRYLAHPSEGSHVSFAPVGTLQMGLLSYMNRKGFDHVSFERVCSGGLGIPNLYAYLKDSGYAEEPDWLAAQLASAEDITPIIVNAAQDKTRSCPLASATLKMFVDILASEAGNLALKVLSTGGIFIGGGIPPRILEHLQNPTFLDLVVSKGRFKDMLSRIPVHIILNAKAGLVGAAAYGLTYL